MADLSSASNHDVLQRLSQTVSLLEARLGTLQVNMSHMQNQLTQLQGWLGHGQAGSGSLELFIEQKAIEQLVRHASTHHPHDDPLGSAWVPSHIGPSNSHPSMTCDVHGTQYSPISVIAQGSNSDPSQQDSQAFCPHCLLATLRLLIDGGKAQAAAEKETSRESA